MKELIKIQSELKAPKNQRNNFGKYNYRSCEDILEALKPLLDKHDCQLTLTDEIKEISTLIYVEATAIIQCKTEHVTVKAQAGIDPNRKGMDIAQSFGSSSSYARKYALNGLFLIDDTKDSDSPQMKVEQEERQKENKPFLKPTDQKWKDAVVKNTPLEVVLEYFKLSEENKKEYIKQLKQ